MIDFMTQVNRLIVSCLLLVAQTASAKDHQLVLNWKPEPQFGGFYAAQVEGIFKKKDLAIAIVPGGAGTPTVQVVAAGNAEFGVVSADEVPISRDRGTDIVALFASYQTCPQSIIAHAEHKYRSIQDIFDSNTTLSVQKGLPYYLFLEKKLGKPKAKVVPYLGGISNFINSPDFSQQGFTTSEPILLAKKNIKVANFPVADEGFNPYLTVLVARKEFIDKNPDLVKKVVEAVREGWRAYLNNPSKTNMFMHQLNPAMDEQTFQESAEAQKKLIETPETQAHGLGFMTFERWKTISEQLAAVGLIRKTPEVKDLFRNI